MQKAFFEGFCRVEKKSLLFGLEGLKTGFSFKLKETRICRLNI